MSGAYERELERSFEGLSLPALIHRLGRVYRPKPPSQTLFKGNGWKEVNRGILRFVEEKGISLEQWVSFTFYALRYSQKVREYGLKLSHFTVSDEHIERFQEVRQRVLSKFRVDAFWAPFPETAYGGLHTNIVYSHQQVFEQAQQVKELSTDSLSIRECVAEVAPELLRLDYIEPEWWAILGLDYGLPLDDHMKQMRSDLRNRFTDPLIRPIVESAKEAVRLRRQYHEAAP